MPQQQSLSTVPHHLQLAQGRPGLRLADVKGVKHPGPLKLARWQGRLVDAHTPERSDFHTISFHVSGASVQRLDAANDLLTPGRAFIQPAHDAGRFQSNGPLDFCHLYVAVGTVAQACAEAERIPRTVREVPVTFGVQSKDFNETIGTLIDKIMAQEGTAHSALDECAYDLALALIVYMARATDHRVDLPTSRGLDAQKLGRVLDYIEANLVQRISLDRLAQEAGLGVFQFFRSFKQDTGFSPYQYVIERRLARACALLDENEMPIVDIAYAVGFSSQAHMTDVFRKRMGVTPGHYRKLRTA